LGGILFWDTAYDKLHLKAKGFAMDKITSKLTQIWNSPI